MYTGRVEANFGKIYNVLNELFKESRVRASELKVIIERLNRDYIMGNVDIKGEKDALGYLLYFLPENIPKIYFVLKEVNTRFGDILSRIEQVYDLGCGVGTATVMIKALSMIDKPIVLIDKNPIMLEMAKRVLGRIGDGEAVTMCLDFLQSFIPPHSPSLYIIMNTLSENYRKREGVVGFIHRLLKENPMNLLVIIEPVNKQAGDVLAMLKREFNSCVLSPCIEEGDCPMLEKEESICCYKIRQDISIALEAVINAGHRMAKFYYLVLSQTRIRQGKNLFRVLNYPSERRYGFDLQVCSGREIYSLKLKVRNSMEKRFIKVVSPNDIIRLDVDRILDNSSVLPCQFNIFYSLNYF
ncbi:MAG: hypothetical protein N2746_08895 [Deltaproteobacteria bacterium]|nr:hypothetical protein [Deltaproteobacteria bacterium]